MVDANTQNTIEELKRKVLYPFGPPGYISSNQGTYFTVQCPTIGKEITHKWTHITYHSQGSNLKKN